MRWLLNFRFHLPTSREREEVVPKPKAKKSSNAAKTDPFKIRSSRQEITKNQDTVEPPGDIAAAVDKFRECQEQAKHFDGEATVYKDLILNFARNQFAQRALSGQTGGFKILGEEGMVTFIVQDSSAGLTEEEVEEISQEYGSEVADDLIGRDYASIRFNPKVLEAHYDEVVSALQKLPEDVLANLFKPMLLKTRESYYAKSQRYTKTPEQFRRLMEQLKLKAYIK